jgi:uncharacterized Zn-finger protein
MSPSRPLPAVLLLGLLGWTLAHVGCDEPSAAHGSAYRSKVVSGSFDIGKPDRYQAKRVYTQYADSHGVYLVSAHGMLVALAAECTNDDHPEAWVRFEDTAGIYRCGTCGARYTRDGLKIGTSQTKVSLRRCRIRSSGHIYDPETTLVVDPDKRFTQEDQEWSKHTSFFPLEEVARGRESKREIERHNRAAAQELPPLMR